MLKRVIRYRKRTGDPVEVPIMEASDHEYRIKLAKHLGIEFDYYYLFSREGKVITLGTKWKDRHCCFGMNKKGDKIILVDITNGKILKWTYIWWSKFLAGLNYQLKWRRTNTESL